MQLTHHNESLENTRLQQKKEIKELKFRETRNLADCSELEDENIQLQKQVRTAAAEEMYAKSSEMLCGDAFKRFVVAGVSTEAEPDRVRINEA